jgi:hypothetical protein
MSSLPDSWTEVCYIEITKEGEFAETTNQFAAITDTVDIDWGEKAIDWTANCIGGRIPTYTPETPTAVTLEMIPVGIAKPEGLGQFFMGDESDVVQPLSTVATRSRFTFRVALLWTSYTSVTKASQEIPITYSGLRFSFDSCKLTGLTYSFTDDILKCTATFSIRPFKKNGTTAITVQESDGTDNMPSLAGVSGATANIHTLNSRSRIN